MDDQSVYCTVNLMWKLVKWQTTSFHHTNHHLFSTPCDLDRLLFSLIAHSDSGSNAASFFVCVLKQWDIHLSLVLDCYQRNSLHSYPFTWVIEIFLLRKCLFLLRGGKHAAASDDWKGPGLSEKSIATFLLSVLHKVVLAMHVCTTSGAFRKIATVDFFGATGLADWNHMTQIR